MNHIVKEPQTSEIDLNDLTRKLGKGFGKFGGYIFNTIQFFIKHGIAIILLLILGLGTGYFLNKTQKKYVHEIIVLPNFNSAESLCFHKEQ